MSLSPEPEAGDQRPVPLDVVRPHVVEQSTTATDEHQQAPPTVVVLLVRLEVLREVVDPLGEQRDLDLRRPGVGLVEPVLADGGCLIGHDASWHCWRATSDPVTR